MDTCAPRRRSLRKNIRNSFKELLDPYADSKSRYYGELDILHGLGLKSSTDDSNVNEDSKIHYDSSPSNKSSDSISENFEQEEKILCKIKSPETKKHGNESPTDFFDKYPMGKSSIPKGENKKQTDMVNLRTPTLKVIKFPFKLDNGRIILSPQIKRLIEESEKKCLLHNKKNTSTKSLAKTTSSRVPKESVIENNLSNCSFSDMETRSTSIENKNIFLNISSEGSDIFNKNDRENEPVNGRVNSGSIFDLPSQVTLVKSPGSKSEDKNFGASTSKEGFTPSTGHYSFLQKENIVKIEVSVLKDILQNPNENLVPDKSTTYLQETPVEKAHKALKEIEGGNEIHKGKEKRNTSAFGTEVANKKFGNNKNVLVTPSKKPRVPKIKNKENEVEEAEHLESVLSNSSQSKSQATVKCYPKKKKGLVSEESPNSYSDFDMNEDPIAKKLDLLFNSSLQSTEEKGDTGDTKDDSMTGEGTDKEGTTNSSARKSQNRKKPKGKNSIGKRKKVISAEYVFSSGDEEEKKDSTEERPLKNTGSDSVKVNEESVFSPPTPDADKLFGSDTSYLPSSPEKPTKNQSKNQKKGAKKPRGKPAVNEKKPKLPRKAPRKKKTSGSQEANESAALESDPTQGDMPLITASTEPSGRKVNEDVTSKRRRQKRVVKEPDPPKKRGRKKIKVEKPTKKEVKEVKFDDEGLDEEAEGRRDEEEEEEEANESSLLEAQKEKKPRKKNQRRTGRRFSVTGYWYIASGYLNDIISLLEDFDGIKSWRFKDFAKCWKDKCFSLVFRGRQTFKELLEFSEEIALLTKRFLSPPHSIKRRIGALYTLYGLYHKFPLGRLQFFTLRFELKEYKELLELIQPFRSNIENPDPAFIFRKLEVEGAFLHCATGIEPCYDFHNEERDCVELEYGKQRLAKSSAVSNAVPKVQLGHDLSLMKHYHSVKANMSGEENPERALTMISPEFLMGISSSLSQLRQDTLRELDMFDETLDASKSKAKGDNLPDDSSLIDPDDGEDKLNHVDENVLETVNRGTYGQKAQKVRENMQLTKDKEVKEFMKPPSEKELIKIVVPSKSTAKSKSKGLVPSYSMEWEDRSKGEVLDKVKEMDDGKVSLVVDAEPPEYKELKEVFLPHPAPPKKKRSRKRPQALLKEASFPSRRRNKTGNNLPIVKSLSDETSNTNEEVGDNPTGLSPTKTKGTSTRLLASELPDGNKEDPDNPITVIKVRMKAEGLHKDVKLKVKVSMEQFKEIQENSTRFSKFKEKLKPLIKETEKGEHKNKDWTIEGIDLVDPEKGRSSPVKREPGSNDVPNHSASEPSSSKTKTPVIPFKKRYECLKYSDDEDDVLDYDDLDDDERFRCKWKTEEEKDYDYSPQEDDYIDFKEEPLEYDDEGIEDDDLHWEPDEPNFFWRRKRKRGYYGYYEVERGPRDSDNLLMPRTEKTVSMVPMRVGKEIKYFPMIKTDEGNKNQQTSNNTVFDGNEASMPMDPRDDGAIFTWNDFSSDKFPPFKKRKSSKGFSYIFSPKQANNANRGNKKPIKKLIVSTDIPERKTLKKILPSQNGEVTETEDENEEPYDEEDDACEEDEDQDEGPSSLPHESPIKPVKTETQSVLEELADDWEDDASVTGAEKEKTLVNKREKAETEEEEKLFSPNVIYFEEEIFSEEAHEPIIDASDFHEECDESLELNKSSDSVVESHNSLTNGEILNDLESFKDTNDPGTLPTPSCSQSESESSPCLPFSPNFSLPEQEQTSKVVVESVPQTSESPSYLPHIMNLGEIDPKNSLFYRMTASDGNDVFIPISSLPQLPSNDIKILSFDVAGVEPLATDNPETPPKLSQTSTESPSLPRLNDSSSSQPKTSQNLIQSPNSIKSDMEEITISPVKLTPIKPGNENSKDTCTEVNYKPTTRSSTKKLSPRETANHTPKKSSSPTKGKSVSKETTKLSPTTNGEASPVGKNSSLETPKPTSNTRSNNSKPACSFFFSPKLRTLKNLPSVVGVASGKVPSPEKPKVKFLFNGFFKSFKNH